MDDRRRSGMNAHNGLDMTGNGRRVGGQGGGRQGGGMLTVHGDSGGALAVNDERRRRKATSDRRFAGNESRQRAFRLWLMLAVLVAASAALVVRVGYIQFAQGEYYAAKSMSQQGPSADVEPVRGSIYDRNGDELAASLPVSFVFISPDEIRATVEERNAYVEERQKKGSSSGGAFGGIADWIESALSGMFPSDEAEGGGKASDTASGAAASSNDSAGFAGSELRKTSLDIVASGLADALGLDAQDIRARLDKNSKYDVLARWADRKDAEAARAFLKGESVYGLYVRDSSKRAYRHGALAAHVVGFTGDDNQGLAGIEAALDAKLAGTPGKSVQGADGSGGMAGDGSVVGIRAQDGLNAVLAIDATIQGIATSALRQAITDANVVNGGAAIVMDPRNGDVLAMVSLPDFDPNSAFAAPEGFDPADWQPRSQAAADILNQTAWRNKAIMDTYEPGSTFKAFTAAAALEEGVAELGSMYVCAPVTVKGWDKPLRCSSTVGHGTLDLVHAVYASCNPAFMSMSQSLGTERFYQYARDFGFADKTGFGLTGEAHGNFHAEPKLIDMLVASFGQRFTITPIELVTGYCAIANGGSLMRPRLVKELTDSAGDVVESYEPEVVRKVISKETADTMREILRGVVDEGTGRNAYVAGYRVAGKTGTSETTEEGRYIASFAAIAPADDPVVCALVMLDNPQGDSHMGGVVAAPVMRRLLEETLEYMGVERVYSEKDQEQLTQQVAVPDVAGLSVDDAVAAIKEAGFGYRLQQGIEDMSATIVRQNPLPGIKVSSGGAVALYVSDMAEPTGVIVPDVAGMSVSRAKEAFAAAGLCMEASGAGLASTQTPSAGNSVEAGTVVRCSFRYLDNVE